MSAWQTASNILAVRLDNIGDVILLSPALRAIKLARPETRLTLLASRAGATAAPLLPWVNDVIVWRAVWQDLGHLAFEPAREMELIELLRERRFDAAFHFTSFSQTPHVAGYVSYLAGIPLRAGSSKEFGGAVLTHELRCHDDAIHQAERNLQLVETVGYPVSDRSLTVEIPEHARALARSILGLAGVDLSRPYIIVHPGASAAARRYPADRFAEIVALLAAGGIQVLVTGSERESELVWAVSESTDAATPLVGQTTLPEYAATVADAAAVVCNDSLPLHLADAVGTPVVALFAGTDLESQWQPRSTPATLLRRQTACAPCYRFECPIGQPCLDIEPRTVVDAVMRLLSEPSTRRREAAQR